MLHELSKRMFSCRQLLCFRLDGLQLLQPKTLQIGLKAKFQKCLSVFRFKLMRAHISNIFNVCSPFQYSKSRQSYPINTEAALKIREPLHSVYLIYWVYKSQSLLCRYQFDRLPSPRAPRGFCTTMCAQPQRFCTTENARGSGQ